MERTTEVDIVIIGAGPAGLCLAHALRPTGLSVAIIDRQRLASLSAPPFDGREIALSQTTIERLKTLSIWSRFPDADVAVLRDARVMNGATPDAGMSIAASLAGRPALGALVPNHLIRRAAFETAQADAHIRWITEKAVTQLTTNDTAACVRLDDGSRLSARLAISADSRFSATRRMMGIGARMRDFGKTMLVARLAHERAHDQKALEWFGYGQTVAVLPLNGQLSSVVLTLPHRDIEPLLALPEAGFARQIENRLQGYLGGMQLASTRHAYPLVGAYAERFVGTRYALAGDAAVGMHPVTAHGFNLGLESVHLLGQSIAQALRSGADPACASHLATYERRLRLATGPLYLATNLVVSLFTDDSRPARWLRQAALSAADHLRPFKQAIAWQLTRRAIR